MAQSQLSGNVKSLASLTNTALSRTSTCNSRPYGVRVRQQQPREDSIASNRENNVTIEDGYPDKNLDQLNNEMNEE